MIIYGTMADSRTFEQRRDCEVLVTLQPSLPCFAVLLESSSTVFNYYAVA